MRFTRNISSAKYLKSPSKSGVTLFCDSICFLLFIRRLAQKWRDNFAGSPLPFPFFFLWGVSFDHGDIFRHLRASSRVLHVRYSVRATVLLETDAGFHRLPPIAAVAVAAAAACSCWCGLPVSPALGVVHLRCLRRPSSGVGGKGAIQVRGYICPLPPVYLTFHSNPAGHVLVRPSLGACIGL